MGRAGLRTLLRVELGGLPVKSAKKWVQLGSKPCFESCASVSARPMPMPGYALPGARTDSLAILRSS
jgi:hypothetical protein